MHFGVDCWSRDTQDAVRSFSASAVLLLVRVLVSSLLHR